MCVFRAYANSCITGMHSVFMTRSLAFELTFHSLLSNIMKPFAQCAAFLRSVGVEPASWPSKCLTMGSKKRSSAKCVSRAWGDGGV